MIEFGLDEDERMIQRTARDFAVGKLKPAAREHERGGVPEALVAEFRGLGLDAIDRPEDLGGGLGPFAQALALEELGAVDVASALALDATAPARYPVLRLGGAEDRRAILGVRRVGLLVDLEQRLSISGGRLSGRVAWCPVKAPSHVVVVRPDGALLFEAAQLQAIPVRALALDAAGGSEIRFESSKAAAHWTGDPSTAMAEVRLYAAALLTGLSRAAYEYAAKYTQERIAFGRPLAQHQAVAFLVVEMAMAVDAARLATWRAAAAIAQQREVGWAAGAALAEASECALTMTNRGVQLLGGHGYMKDHPVEKWMREARALTLAWGGPEALSATLAATFEPQELESAHG